LLHRDPEATGLEETAERGGGEALPQAGGHPTGHEDVLRQDLLFHPTREIRRKAKVPDDLSRAAHPSRDFVVSRPLMPPSSARGVEAVEAPPVAPLHRRHWRTDALVVAIATVVIRLPAF